MSFAMVYLNGIFLLGFEFDSTCSVPNIIFLLIYIPWTPMIYIYIYMIIYVYYIYRMYMYVSIPVVSYCIAIFQSRIPYSTNGIFRTEAWPKPHWSRPHHYCGYGLFSIMKITASNITNILILRFMIYKLLMVNYFLLFLCQCYGLGFVIDCF